MRQTYTDGFGSYVTLFFWPWEIPEIDHNAKLICKLGYDRAQLFIHYERVQALLLKQKLDSSTTLRYKIKARRAVQLLSLGVEKLRERLREKLTVKNAVQLARWLHQLGEKKTLALPAANSWNSARLTRVHSGPYAGAVGIVFWLSGSRAAMRLSDRRDPFGRFADVIFVNLSQLS